ncbi:hypothetical protein CVT24_003475 [Panaeolus cyanescens]|uniref:Protein kinase domain-containing protein n=1 Tax=Panaeolus cyanescens TaxID=181874 RepID=A0A409Y7M3_9AGAR|nr:hypothetical protein CVT24_003475 [Panaeolus cyanescens]
MRYHMALYMAIVDDALSRAVIEPDAETTHGRSRKRRATETLVATRASKRLKGEAPSANASSVDLYAEIASRHVLLVSFDFGIYHSPAPSSFLRVRPSCRPDFLSKDFKPPKANCKYPLTKCLNFVAKEKLGRGAIGTAFRGTLELETEEGCIVDENIVLKIPLGTKPAERIYDEYSWYERLAKAGVTEGIVKVHGIFEDVETGATALMMQYGAERIYDEYSWYERLAKAGVTEGIVKVHGIFEDVETGATALMMQYGGTSLLHRERLRMPRKTRGDELSSTQVTLSEGELKQLLKIIRGINDAGITHNDLKPDNIVVDDAGRMSIIDFDMAEDIYLRKNYTRTPDSDAAQGMFDRTFATTKYYVR